MDQQEFLKELSKLRTSSMFLTLHGYRNEASEVADYSIAFHMSYKSALERSIEKLQAMSLTKELEKLAREELIASFQKSLLKMETVPMEERDDAYAHFIGENGQIIKGVKLHLATSTLHLYGLVVHKLVKMPGSYPKVNHKPLTVAKDKLRYMTPAGKFRQFRITPDQVDRIVVQGKSLLPPDDSVVVE